MTRLIFFHGQECPHCRKMMPIVDRLEKDTGFAFEKREVWHSQENADLMRSFRSVIAPHCGGQLRVPAFFNPESHAVMCGEVAYDKLREWVEQETGTAAQSRGRGGKASG